MDSNSCHLVTPAYQHTPRVPSSLLPPTPPTPPQSPTPGAARPRLPALHSAPRATPGGRRSFGRRRGAPWGGARRCSWRWHRRSWGSHRSGRGGWHARGSGGGSAWTRARRPDIFKWVQEKLDMFCRWNHHFEGTDWPSRKCMTGRCAGLHRCLFFQGKALLHLSIDSCLYGAATASGERCGEASKSSKIFTKASKSSKSSLKSSSQRLGRKAAPPPPAN